MSTPQTSAKTIFLEALELITVTEREAYLDTQCGSDADLRREVEKLLRHHGDVGSFLESPPKAVVESAEQLHTIAPPSPSLAFLAPSSRADSLGRLGHYEILEVVGSGGMGIVLKAFDERLQRIVAIKAMAPPLAASATGRRRFVREAQAAAAVNHDNVVDIYAVEETGPIPYLVMEYVAGISLEDKLTQQGPLKLEEILRIGLQTADGLAAAHRQGLVHRDVKPANILLENGVGRVKITDFGLARAADDVSVTQTGVIAGTPAYMSPEQARGDAVDHRSDLFSLGSVLYALCAGRTPFRGSTSLGVLKQVCEEQPHPIRDLNPDIPEWLCAIVERLHAKLPAERFQSAAELAEALGRYLAHVQQPSLPLPTGIVPAAALQLPHAPNTAHGSRRAGRLWAIAAAAALVVLGATLSLTDASGITHVAATVIRIFTPEGTLVVEVDDPGVKVTIEGDGGLVITGAGAQEVRVKPGSYKVQATKDGQPVPVDQELVTITTGGKQVVKVRREEGLTSKPLSQAQKLEQARQQLEEADRLYKLGEPLRGPDPWQAELHFRKAVAIYEKLGQDFPESPASKQKLAACRWGLASALNMQVHHLIYKGTELTAAEAAQAIAAGKEVMELAPSDAGFWTNLGLAHYRAKDWNSALAALEKGPATQDYNSSHTRFGLALVHWQLGHQDQARQFYDQAVQWMDQNKPNDPWLRRDRAEAKALLEQQ
jgi:serine/threonine protein kinase